MAIPFTPYQTSEVEKVPESNLSVKILQHNIDGKGDLIYLPEVTVPAYERIFTIADTSKPENDTNNRYPAFVAVIREELSGESLYTKTDYEPNKFGATYIINFKGDIVTDIFPELKEIRFTCKATSERPNTPYVCSGDILRTLQIVGIDKFNEVEPIEQIDDSPYERITQLADFLHDNIYRKLLNESGNNLELRLYLQDIDAACSMLIAIAREIRERQTKSKEHWIPESFKKAAETSRQSI